MDGEPLFKIMILVLLAYVFLGELTHTGFGDLIDKNHLIGQLPFGKLVADGAKEAVLKSLKAGEYRA